MLSAYRGNSGATSPQASDKPILVTPAGGGTFPIEIGVTDVTNGTLNELLTTDAAGKLDQLALTAGTGIAINIAAGVITVDNTLPYTGLTIGDSIIGGAGSSILYEDTSNTLAENSNLLFDAATGQLRLASSGNTAGILIGTDTQLYRDAADILRTPDSFTIDGNLIISGIGPHAIGTTIVTARQINIGGAFAGQNALRVGTTLSPASGFSNLISATGTINAAAGTSCGAIYSDGTLNKAATGTHPVFAGIYIFPPAIGAGASALTNAASLYISAAPTGATNNYSLFIDAGAARFDGGLDITANNTFALTNQTNGAGVALGTLTNAPAAGDPAFWIPMVVNGVNRYIPAW